MSADKLRLHAEGGHFPVNVGLDAAHIGNDAAVADVSLQKTQIFHVFLDRRAQKNIVAVIEI